MFVLGKASVNFPSSKFSILYLKVNSYVSLLQDYLLDCGVGLFLFADQGVSHSHNIPVSMFGS